MCRARWVEGNRSGAGCVRKGLSIRTRPCPLSSWSWVTAHVATVECSRTQGVQRDGAQRPYFNEMSVQTRATKARGADCSLGNHTLPPPSCFLSFICLTISTEAQGRCFSQRPVGRADSECGGPLPRSQNSFCLESGRLVTPEGSVFPAAKPPSLNLA